MYRSPMLSLAPSRVEELRAFLLARFEVSNGCWRWIGAVDRHGYGKFEYRSDGRRRMTGAHRAAWLLLRGEIAEGLVIDHLCRNRLCVNPAHLDVVTPLENFQRGLVPLANRGEVSGTYAQRRVKKYCQHGHLLEGENLLIAAGRPGSTRQVCRACNRRRVNEFNARRRSSSTGEG